MLGFSNQTQPSSLTVGHPVATPAPMLVAASEPTPLDWAAVIAWLLMLVLLAAFLAAVGVTALLEPPG